MKKLAFVTGGSRGIGRAIVKELVDSNWDVVFTYCESAEEGKQLAKETGALALRCDVRSMDQLFNCYSQGRIYFGQSSYDLVVCNAGISKSGLFSQMNQEDENQLIDVNIKGVMNTAKVAVDNLVEAKSGSIVCISSMWGLAAAPYEVTYSTTKAAIVGFVRSLAKELGPSNVRVNAIAPGVIITDMVKDIAPEIMESLREATPLGRFGQPEDVAKVVKFLGSDDSSFMTGQVLSVDGGFII